MKKFLLILGIFLLPATASAQALSPWVQGVLDRAEEGISMAGGLGPAICDNDTLQSEISDNRSLARSMLDATTQLEQESQLLAERTTCFEYDRALLRQKLVKIQNEMNAAIEACQINRNRMLRVNYQFVAEALQSLLRGGIDPTVRDDRLQYKYAFHDKALLDQQIDQQIVENSTEPLCPFTSDYAPRSVAYIPTGVGSAASAGDASFDVKSFGCDVTALGSVGIAPVDAEAAVFRDFLSQTQEFALTVYNTVSQAVRNIDETIGIITGIKKPRPDARPGIIPSHETVSGCLKPLSPDLSSIDAQGLEDLLAAYPNFFGPENLRAVDGGGTTYDPKPGETLPTGLLFQASFDRFGVTPASYALVRSFVDRREALGYNRPLPGGMQSPNDENTVDTTYFTGIINPALLQNELRNISSNIERETGILDAINRDAAQRLKDASMPLEQAVQSLVYVTDDFLPKKYVPQLTLFMARSCVDGFCQDTLKHVAQRIMNPYCHPYVSGKYMDEKAADKCFCTPEFENEDYCKGQVDTSDQPEEQLQCGEKFQQQ